HRGPAADDLLRGHLAGAHDGRDRHPPVDRAAWPPTRDGRALSVVDDAVPRKGSSAPALPVRPLRVVIAGGGTGGHIVPAIALARALTERPEGEQGEPGEAADVRIVGRQGGPEESTVRAQGIAFEGIDVLGFQRSVSPRNLLAAARGAAATVRALRILRRARADVAVGTGGYVSIPVATAAAMLRIPL